MAYKTIQKQLVTLSINKTLDAPANPKYKQIHTNLRYLVFKHKYWLEDEPFSTVNQAFGILTNTFLEYWLFHVNTHAPLLYV